MEELPPDVAAKIDSLVDELDSDFFNAADEFSQSMKQKRPDLFGPNGEIDERFIFQAWAIQKLAKLQYLVSSLAERVSELEQRK